MSDAEKAVLMMRSGPADAAYLNALSVDNNRTPAERETEAAIYARHLDGVPLAWIRMVVRYQQHRAAQGAQP